ncbi:MAG: ABC transporter ATP-binding protein [Endomicrobium sp.]|jgi:ABC-2 type transport system ATP-binding protein|nr:ABC transporter ATP-binding protein [Endomicrobium sp.]
MQLLSVIIGNATKLMCTTEALINVSAIFEGGLVHAIIGPNGAGKTTLTRVIAGLLKLNDGNIEYFLENQRITQVKTCLGYFPQESSLYSDLTCQEHLEFFKELYNIDKKEFAIRSNRLYEATGMFQFKDVRVGSLSGGMYKKLGLMCVLLNRPKLLLLDEPTIGVDPVSRVELWDLIYSFAKNSITIIMTTSYMDEAKRADKIHVLNEGRLLMSGKPMELMNKYHLDKIEDIFFKNSEQ